MMNQYSSTYRSEEGLTLLEIMISIALLGFVMIGVVAIIDNSQNTKDRIVIQDRDNLQIEMALNRLEWDFSQMWSPLYFSQRFQGNLDPNANPGIEEVRFLYDNHPRFRSPSRDGIPIPIFKALTKDDFIFLTASNRRRSENQAQSHFMWVRYFLGDSVIFDESSGQDRNTKSLQRQVFADDPWAKEEFPIDTTKAAVLLENVENLEFKFWNKGTLKWEDNLRSIRDGESLVRGVQLSLKWKDSSGIERETIRYFRPSWQPVVVQDPMGGGVQAAAQAGAQAGVDAGTTNGGNQGGNQAGSTGGSPGGSF
jgi:type II secretory pathway pseudopilin PulG